MGIVPPNAALCAAGIVSICVFTQSVRAIDVNLNSWSQQGETTESNWIVAGDGSNVLQTTNGGVGLFVSPEQFFDTTINGQLSVETTSDNDMIGFVFAYTAPIDEATNVGQNTVDFILFDWKQSVQSGAPEGFRLSHIVGTHKGTSSDVSHELWDHIGDEDIDINPLATNTGVGLGWQNPVSSVPVVYDFTLSYTADNITIDMAGGQFGSGQNIFDVDFDSLAPEIQAAIGDAFQSGQFGFYNYSQQDVRYNGFTRTDNPPDEEDENDGGNGDGPQGEIPAPAALPAGLALIGLLGARRQRRR